MRKFLKVPFLKLNYKPPRFVKAGTTTQTHQLDLRLLSGVILLSLFGLLMVYNVSSFKAFQDFNDKYYFIRQQSISVLLGFLLLGFFSVFDYHNLRKISFVFFIFSLALLFLVFVPGLGVMTGGAHRWLRVAGFTLQPAEIIKLATVVFLAAVFEKRLRTRPFLAVVIVVGAVVGLLQRDLGSTIVFSSLAFSMYFVAGARIHHLFFVGLGGVVGMAAFIIAAPYRVKRVLAFLDPFTDSQGFSYHITQVLIALGSGGFWGLGIGQSRQKFAYIPEVTTDSIFAIIGEELGFIGSVILLAVFGYIIIRGFKIAEGAPDNFGRLLAVGLISWLAVQIAVNIAAMVSLMPLTGVPLPFISYGGSALVVNLIAVGILLNISKQGVRK